MNDQLREPATTNSGVPSVQEIAAQEIARQLYGKRIGEVAGQVAYVLGMSESASLEFVEVAGAAAADLGPGGQREVAVQLNELLALLGGAAVTGPGLPEDEELIRRLAHLSGEAADPAEPIGVGMPEDDSNGANAAKDNGSASSAPEPQEAGRAPTLQEAAAITDKPLNEAQAAWIISALGEERAGLIAALPFSQRMEFTQKLGELYTDIHVRQVNPKGKRDRFSRVIALMSGKSYAAIAEHSILNANAVKAQLEETATAIRKKVPEEEIVALMSEVDSGGMLMEGTGEDVPLWDMTKDQRNWLVKIFDQSGEVRNLERLDTAQREYLSGQLGERLRTYEAGRSNATTTDRRVDELCQLIAGSTYEEIACMAGLSESKVKNELHVVAVALHEEITPDERSDLLERVHRHRLSAAADTEV